MRTTTTATAQSIVAGEREDFLTSNGYKVFGELLNSVPQNQLLSDGSLSTDRVRSKKLYYYAALEN